MLHQSHQTLVSGGSALGSKPLLALPCRARSRKQLRRCVTSAVVAPSLSASPAMTVVDAPEPVWVDNLVKWARPPKLTRVMAPDRAPPIVILPGFGNNSDDYSAPFGQREESLVTHLEARGFKVFVVPLERKDWLRVARGLLTLGFWRSTLTTHPGYTWYLERVAATVERAIKETGASQVDIVGHSAGGWLGRAYLADPLYMPAGAAAAASAAAGIAHTPASLKSEADAEMAAISAATVAVGPTAGPNRYVRSLVTLGTPHSPPPPAKGKDMTGGALGWLEASYPGAHFAQQGVRYVCVSGRTVRGHKPSPQQAAAAAAAAKRGGAKRTSRTPPEYASDSYTQVCGEGHGVVGDCVVPLQSSLLPGAQHIVLDGVFHSMSRVGTFEESSGLVWYGSDDVIDCWLHALVA